MTTMGHATKRPTGTAFVLSSALVIVARHLGVDLTEEESFTLIAAATILTAAKNPLP